MDLLPQPVASTSTPRTSLTANLPTPTRFLANSPPAASPTAAPTNRHAFELASRLRRQKRQHELEERDGDVPERMDWGALQPRRTDGLPFATGCELS